MFRRKNGEEYYTFPGGHMREGEEPVETAIREILEETTVTVVGMEPAFEFRNFVKPKKTKIEYYFVGNWESGDPQLSGEESRRMSEENYYEPMWVPIEDLNSLNLLPMLAKEWVIDDLEKFLRKRE